MVNSFVIGKVVLRKHRMVIDFNNNNLLIKSENMHAFDYVVDLQRREVKVCMVRSIIPGAIGLVCLHNFSHKGLTSDKATITTHIDLTFYCMVIKNLGD